MKNEILLIVLGGAATLLIAVIGWFVTRLFSQYDEYMKKFDARLDSLNGLVLRDVDRRLILLESRMDAAFEILEGKRQIRKI